VATLWDWQTTRGRGPAVQVAADGGGRLAEWAAAVGAVLVACGHKGPVEGRVVEHWGGQTAAPLGSDAPQVVAADGGAHLEVPVVLVIVVRVVLLEGVGNTNGGSVGLALSLVASAAQGGPGGALTLLAPLDAGRLLSRAQLQEIPNFEA